MKFQVFSFQLTRSYFLGRGIDDIVMRTDGTNRQYFYKNGLGSVVAVANNSGNLLESYEYNLQGQVAMFNGGGSSLTASSIGNDHLFTGRQLDPETGDYYYRARYYSPILGRFISRDPLSGAEFSQGTNLYAYCRNNGVNGVDPTGMCEEDKEPEPEPEDPKPVDDEDIDRELERIYLVLKDTNPNPITSPIAYYALMTSTQLDTSYGPYIKTNFSYTGTKYPGLNGTMKGSEINYIGVGAGFAAGGIPKPVMNAIIGGWKSSQYSGQVPSTNTLNAANTGYNAYKNK
jgi:RHS repeat-associated protein